jgi:hypothetical protein
MDRADIRHGGRGPADVMPGLLLDQGLSDDWLEGGLKNYAVNAWRSQ